MRGFFVVFLFFIAFVSVANAEGNKITVIDSFDIDKSEPRGLQEKNRVSVLCIDGYKFVSSYGWSAWSGRTGVGTGAGVSMVQFYEEKEGKTVPARCDSSVSGESESGQAN